MAVISLSVKPSVKIVHRNFQFLFGNRAPSSHTCQGRPGNEATTRDFKAEYSLIPRLLTDVLGMSQTKLTSLLGSPALVAYFTKLIYNPGFNFNFQIVIVVVFVCVFVYLRKVVRYDAAGKWCANGFTEGER